MPANSHGFLTPGGEVQGGPDLGVGEMIDEDKTRPSAGKLRSGDDLHIHSDINNHKPQPPPIVREAMKDADGTQWSIEVPPLFGESHDQCLKRINSQWDSLQRKLAPEGMLKLVHF